MMNLIYPAAKESSNRVEEKIIEDLVVVAVGKQVEASKLTLLWAIRNSGRKKICILHVHQFKKKLISGGMSEKKPSETEREVLKVLEEYDEFCAKQGVKPEHLLKTTNGPIEKGIVDFVTNPEHRIGKLVMGAASDRKYSQKMIEPKSQKAIYVWKNRPAYCKIWFICKGYLIYTTEDSKASSPGHGAKRPEMMKPQQLPSGEPSTSKTRVDSERNVDGLDCSKEFEAITDSPSPSIKRTGDKGKGTPLEALLQDEEKSRGSSYPRDLGSGVNSRLYEELEKAKAVAEKSKLQADKDLMKLRIAKRESIKAVEEAKEELEKTREAEQELTIVMEELEDLKENRDSILEDLAKAKEELAKAKKELEDTKNENVVLLGELCADLDEKSSLVIRVEKVE